MIQVKRYSAEHSTEWNDFVKASKNGTFLFLREYMDYHSDRFHDHSLMYYKGNGTSCDKLIAIMPANEDDDILYSHQGLTYGGIIMSKGIHASEVQEIFCRTCEYLSQQGFSEWYYKQMPTIYHHGPAEEDEYWLWRLDAEMECCAISSTVDLRDGNRLPAEYCRRNALTRLGRQGIRLNTSASLEFFMHILTNHLHEKYNVAPAHTLAEMQLLQSRFPDRIHCCAAENEDGEMLAGVIMYECGSVAHVQYSSASDHGLRTDAQDFLYLSLINHYATKPEVRYFDFGISTENGGRHLNDTLIRHKEGFGARGIVYKHWRIKIS